MWPRAAMARSWLLEVTDSGAGWDEATAPPGKGFGVTQVRERLATLYGDAASLAFEQPPPGGVRAVIRIPIDA
jgi:signal transduction histidine kinase